MVAGLTIAACGSEPDTATSPNTSGAAVTEPPRTTALPAANSAETAPAPADSTTTPSPAAEVPEILSFTAPLLGGGTFDGAAYAGAPLALWFWAPT